MSGARHGRLARTLAGTICLVGLSLWEPSHGLAQADDDLDLGEDSADESSDTADSVDEDEPAPEQEPQPTAASADEPAEPRARGVLVSSYAGLGASSRMYERPTKNGAQRIQTAFVPAVEVGLSVLAWPDADFSLSFDLHYQTALGLTVTEAPPVALDNEQPVRSERIELMVAPTWRLGAGPTAARLAFPIGAGVRTFWPSTHSLMTQGYSLIGPQARVEFVAALGGPLSLRVGPEFQWIIGIDEVIVNDGVNRQAFAVGGELTLMVELTSVWSLGLHYRESHAFASSTGSVSFVDVERYMTARLSGMF